MKQGRVTIFGTFVMFAAMVFSCHTIYANHHEHEKEAGWAISAAEKKDCICRSLDTYP